jgi:hypothetical protein
VDAVDEMDEMDEMDVIQRIQLGVDEHWMRWMAGMAPRWG